MLREGERKGAAAARALGALGVAEAVPVLVDRLARGSDEERAAAASALGQLRAKSAVDSLKRLLLDPSPAVRGEVLVALRAITGLTFGEEGRKNQVG